MHPVSACSLRLEARDHANTPDSWELNPDNQGQIWTLSSMLTLNQQLMRPRKRGTLWTLHKKKPSQIHRRLVFACRRGSYWTFLARIGKRLSPGLLNIFVFLHLYMCTPTSDLFINLRYNLDERSNSHFMVGLHHHREAFIISSSENNDEQKDPEISGIPHSEQIFMPAIESYGRETSVINTHVDGKRTQCTAKKDDHTRNILWLRPANTNEKQYVDEWIEKSKYQWWSSKQYGASISIEFRLDQNSFFQRWMEAFLMERQCQELNPVLKMNKQTLHVFKVVLYQKGSSPRTKVYAKRWFNLTRNWKPFS